MKKIRFTTLIPLAISCLGCVSCTFENNAKKTIFNNLSQEFYIPKQSMKLYFPEKCNLPYVDVKTFIKDLNGFFISDYIGVNVDKINNQLTLSIPMLLGLSPIVTFNWETDIIEADQSFFQVIALENQVTSFDSHFQIDESKSSETEPQKVKYNLKKYNFDIKYDNGKVLVPLVIANALFCSHNYYNIVYNGQQLFGFYGENRNSNSVYRINDSKYNGTEIPEDIAQATLDSFNFFVDYFYGLKDLRNMRDAKDYFSKEDQNLLSSTSYADHVKGIDNLVFKTLTDLHSRVDFYTYYNDKRIQDNPPLNERGLFWQAFYQTREQLTNSRRQAFEDVPPVRYSGDTAIITFDSFVTGSQYDLIRKDAYNYDTFEFMKYVMNDIKTHDEINDVCIDLSNNGGGNIAAMVNALGFISDDFIYYNIVDTLTKSTVRAAFEVDTDGDGIFTNDAYSKYRWTVLSSLGTFSAANLFTSIFQSQGLGKVLGQTSGGGMCGVLPLVLADGTAFTLSGNQTFRKYNNGVFEPIEYGVEPDGELDYQYFYNDTKLVDAIDNLYR